MTPQEAKASSRKALLLRVRMDRGTGGALGPIFRDGTFEYVPIPEAVPTRSPSTYATLPGRHSRSLASVLPARLAERHPHIDPDFQTATYGDAAPRKRAQLLRLAAGDLLVFYAGLAPDPPEDRARLFAVGSLRVKQVHRLSARDIDRSDLQRRFGRTAHFLRRTRDQDLALVEGHADRSKLFAHAIPLADGSDRLLRDLACVGYEGSLLRAVGHWITGAAPLRSLEAWLRRGPVSLVGGDTRLIAVSAAALHPAESGHDLAIDDPRPREGDWVIVAGERGSAGVRAFGRVNRTVRRNGGRRAFASVFWRFGGDVAAPCSSAVAPLLHGRDGADPPSIRRTASWFAGHYRIGLHRLPAVASARPPSSAAADAHSEERDTL
jgi:hypothetical protein